MTLRLNGSTSGYVEIDAPAVAGSTSITIPATTGGEFVVSDSSGNVGLGTTSPAEELHINSATPSIRLSDTAGSNLITRITNSQGDLYFDADFGGTTGDIIFRSNGTLGRWVAGGGLAFGTDTAAVNQLDDYEEGTWTPTIDIGGLTAGITYSSQAGIYTKIGDVVTVGCYVILSSKGLNTGTVRIDGLPFAANIPVGPVNAGVLVNEVNNANWPQSMSYGLVWSDGYVYLRYNGTTAWAGITDTNLTNNSQIYWSSTFKVS